MERGFSAWHSHHVFGDNMENMKRRLARVRHAVHRVTHTIVKLEYPFHLSYLGSITVYYASHDVMSIAAFSGGLFIIVLIAHFDKGD